ncbi:hypothetical protein RDG65_002351 [Vibrio fluvialis]|uniref:hypothetical protein n=1 Tax=Vibrio fluvialis TaxID=676 RepID=UPI001F3C017C|nr:hypothetical protein [Vibrio fluvialis]EKO3372894.1 hypothetical protein [Vibrio fluvialis]ELE5027048.1 hypothetical protein [Vibrio fluvialis]MCE7610588.1 hypothetical protein [Vibrio fluvialis]MCE7621493.1 hypothetical protein [Vibrio fluvialis]MCE7630519.1 hypothetical protein [Vibrio fluvialis]
MNVTETIILGVISGVLTTGLLWITATLINNTISPLIKRMLYRGADVSGVWSIKKKNPRPDGHSDVSYTLAINQSAEKVKGTFQIDYGSSDKSFVTVYDVTGEYWEGYFTFIFRSKNKKEYSQGVMLMKAIHGGQAMEGSICFRDVVQDKSVTINLLLARSYHQK